MPAPRVAMRAASTPSNAAAASLGGRENTADVTLDLLQLAKAKLGVK